jgi:hypothetical protein
MDALEQLRFFEKRYNLTSEEFLEGYYGAEEHEIVPVRSWIACVRIKGRLVRDSDALAWAILCLGAGIGGDR